MPKALNFEEVYSGVAAGDEREPEVQRNKPVEVNVIVAGVEEEPETKTVQFSTTNEGLVQIQFKEGGKLPPEMRGRFTSTTEALSAVSQWVARKEREVKVDSTVKVSGGEGTPAPAPTSGPETQVFDDLYENEPQVEEETVTVEAAQEEAKAAEVEVAGQGETLSLRGKGNKKRK